VADTVAPVADILAALAYGERLAAVRARENLALAPDGRRRSAQQGIADREQRNHELISARLGELADPELEERFRPFLDAFFERTGPQAMTWHYVGDAWVSDFADVLAPFLDAVSAEVIRRAIGDREDSETFALDELGRLMEDDPGVRDEIAGYARKIVGEALTQTRKAIQETRVLASLMGGIEGMEKRMVLDILEGHRRRLDRLGIEPVLEVDDSED
jgi:tRNA-(MS[2]IO[6]A)-hydroxylase MiaE-like protein